MPNSDEPLHDGCLRRPDFSDADPQVEGTDGATPVPLVSLAGCTRWRRAQAAPVFFASYANVVHAQPTAYEEPLADILAALEAQ